MAGINYVSFPLGGIFGSLESVYNEVPQIIIPFFFDQFRNAIQAERMGYAKYLNFKEFTTETLVNTIQELTTDSSYMKKTKEISDAFKTNIIQPLDEAVWWIEYVAKFRGAKHFKSHAVNMHWFSYLMLDVFSVIALGVLSIIFAIYLVIKTVLSKKTSKAHKKQKRN